MCLFLKLVLIHDYQRLVLSFLCAENCKYFSIDEYNQKANVYFLPLTKVFQDVYDMILEKKPYVGVSPLQMDSPSCDTYRLRSLLRSLGDPSPRTDVMFHDFVKLGRGFSQLSFMYVLFSFNIFFITHFRVVLSFRPPLDHNTLFTWLPTHI